MISGVPRSNVKKKNGTKIFLRTSKEKVSKDGRQRVEIQLS